VVTATSGDFIESAIKRDLDLKDMGALLPGHGGVLDRLDSVLLTSPFVWAILNLVS
jgi:phosphatidate cytidylyltransferase